MMRLPGRTTPNPNQFAGSVTPSPQKGDASQQNIFATSQKKMRTTVPKENRCTIEVSDEVVAVIFIARQKRNVEVVHKRSYVLQVPIGDCLCIGKSQRDKQFANWQVRLITSVPNELVTRSKLCSLNSSNRSSCARYDCDACGTSLSSSTLQQQRKTQNGW